MYQYFLMKIGTTDIQATILFQETDERRRWYQLLSFLVILTYHVIGAVGFMPSLAIRVDIEIYTLYITWTNDIQLHMSGWVLKTIMWPVVTKPDQK